MRTSPEAVAYTGVLLLPLKSKPRCIRVRRGSIGSCRMPKGLVTSGVVTGMRKTSPTPAIPSATGSLDPVSIRLSVRSVAGPSLWASDGWRTMFRVSRSKRDVAPQPRANDEKTVSVRITLNMTTIVTNACAQRKNTPESPAISIAWGLAERYNAQL